MPVSNTQDVAKTQETPEVVELTVTQLDEVTGGDPATTAATIKATQQPTATKVANNTDAYIRS